MSLIKQLRHELSTHIRHSADLTQTFYKKITKKYLNPTKCLNSTLIKDKQHRHEKEIILSAMQEEMSKQLHRLPFIKNPQQWMTMGMIKNKPYCRKRGDRYHIKSSDNLQKVHKQFVISEYYRKIGAMKKKDNPESSKSMVANPNKFPIIKNNINSLYLAPL